MSCSNAEMREMWLAVLVYCTYRIVASVDPEQSHCNFVHVVRSTTSIMIGGL